MIVCRTQDSKEQQQCFGLRWDWGRTQGSQCWTSKMANSGKAVNRNRNNCAPVLVKLSFYSVQCYSLKTMDVCWVTIVNRNSKERGKGEGAYTQHLFACAAYDTCDTLLSPAPVAAIGRVYVTYPGVTQRQQSVMSFDLDLNFIRIWRKLVLLTCEINELLLPF